MSKLLYATTILILLSVLGCGYSIPDKLPDYKTIKDRDLPGNKYIAQNFKIQLNDDRDFPFVFNLEKRVKDDKSREYYLVFVDVTINDSTVEILNEGKSLILYVDSTKIDFKRNSDFKVETVHMRYEEPTFLRSREYLYPITLKQLQTIANAQTVEIELFSDIDNYKGKFLPVDINRFKVFLEKYSNK